MNGKKKTIPDKKIKATTLDLKGSKTLRKQSTHSIKSGSRFIDGLLGFVSSFYCDFHLLACLQMFYSENKKESHKTGYSKKSLTCMNRPSDVPRLAMVRSPLMKVDIDVKSTWLNWPMNKSTRCKAVVNSVRYSSLRTSQPDEFLSRVWNKIWP